MEIAQWRMKDTLQVERKVVQKGRQQRKLQSKNVQRVYISLID